MTTGQRETHPIKCKSVDTNQDFWGEAVIVLGFTPGLTMGAGWGMTSVIDLRLLILMVMSLNHQLHRFFSH